jgi:hypothetical protein
MDNSETTLVSQNKDKQNKNKTKTKQNATQKTGATQTHQNPRVNTAGCSILIRHPDAPCYLHMHSQVQ